VRIEILTGQDGWPLIAALESSVYPPKVMARVVWRDVAWAHADARILVREDAEIVCHVGIYERDGTHDGAPRRITGIGGVMTAPDARRRGYASAAMREAAHLMGARGADFGLLFCEPHNESLYEGLGWRKFAGEVYCEQPRGRIRFDLMATMVLPVRSTAEGGVIDLCGLPW
jgi:ribosomal protein S18 acetylase RimI-like enzyme